MLTFRQRILKASGNLIQNLKKPHGDNMISIRMLKFCKSICKALYIIFKSCLTQDIFSSEWKAENALIHKKKKKKKKKKKTNSVLKTTYLSLLFQSVAKFLKVLFFITRCSHILH